VATILPEMHELRWVHSFTAGAQGEPDPDFDTKGYLFPHPFVDEN